MKTALILFFIFISTSLFCEEDFEARRLEQEKQLREWEAEQQEAIKRWRKDMEKDRQLIQKYFKGDIFKQFNKEIDKVLKSTDPGLFQNFFDDKNIDKLLKGSGLSSGLKEGDFRWIETPLEKILILKMKLKEDAPFEIKIENNHIIIKGEITETIDQKTEAGTNFFSSKWSRCFKS